MGRLLPTYQVEGVELDWIDLPSQNRSPRIAGSVELIVLHSMGFDLDHCLEILSTPDHPAVSAHFFIPSVPAKLICASPRYPEKVPIFSLVPVHEVAFHAGVSAFADFKDRYPSCERSLNDISIGIEFHAPGAGLNARGELDVYSFCAFPEEGIATGLTLVAYLVKKMNIHPSMVLGHSDIAPDRKTDPGPLFPYKQFFDMGWGPNIELPQEALTLESCQAWLKGLGYPIPNQASWEETEPFFKVLLHKLYCVEDTRGLWRFPLSLRRAIGFIEQIKRK